MRPDIFGCACAGLPAPGAVRRKVTRPEAPGPDVPLTGRFRITFSFVLLLRSQSCHSTIGNTESFGVRRMAFQTPKSRMTCFAKLDPWNTMKHRRAFPGRGSALAGHDQENGWAGQAYLCSHLLLLRNGWAIAHPSRDLRMLRQADPLPGLPQFQRGPDAASSPAACASCRTGP